MTDRPVVVVTGASQGLGAAVSRQAAQLGAGLSLAARSQRQLDELAEEIAKAGGQALVTPTDVGDEHSCRVLIKQTLQHFGRIDALVNNAGTIEPIAPIAEANLQALKRSWQVNVHGALLLSKLALPGLRLTHGRIINLTSGSVEKGVGGWGAYTISKAAIEQLTKNLAIEEPQVTVLAVRPGIVDTGMQATIRAKGKGHMAERNYNWLAGKHARGELLHPDLPGRAIACLALFAPQSWGGEILDWDDPRLQQLVGSHFPK